MQHHSPSALKHAAAFLEEITTSVKVAKMLYRRHPADPGPFSDCVTTSTDIATAVGYPFDVPFATSPNDPKWHPTGRAWPTSSIVASSWRKPTQTDDKRRAREGSVCA